MLKNNRKETDIVESDDYPMLIAMQCHLNTPKDRVLERYPILKYVDSDIKYGIFTNMLRKLSVLGISPEIGLNLMDNISSGYTTSYVIENLALKMEKIPEYLSIFKKYGISNMESALILSQSPLTSYNLKNLESMIVFYLKIGISKSELKEKIIDDPNMLNYESTNSFDIVKILNSMGMNVIEIKDLILSTSSDKTFTLLDFNTMKNASIIKKLSQFNFTNQEIASLIKKDHHVLISDEIVNVVLNQIKSFDVPDEVIKDLVIETPVILYSKFAGNAINVIRAYKLQRYMRTLILHDRKLFIDILTGNTDIDSKYSERINLIRNSENNEEDDRYD